MLDKGADYLDKDIDRAVKALLVKLEPAMTVIIGAVAGLLLKWECICPYSTTWLI